MVKFQLVSSLLFLGANCSTFPHMSLAGMSTKLNKSSSVDAIADKISGSELYLKSVCLNKYMDAPLVTKIIRETLVNFEFLSKAEANFVEPEHLLLTGENYYKLLFWDGSVVAFSKKITLIVESHSDITTWNVDDYDFHFITYFTPKDYLWLRNILMHDSKFSTDEWFLGCLMQVLDDNHFNSADAYYNIPWTDSLKTIFSWDNRLVNHMGHFGSWDMLKSEVINWMINRECRHKGWRWLEVCSNIDTLMHNLRNFFNYQTAKNNFGMYLNLEWNYNSGSMSLQCVHIFDKKINISIIERGIVLIYKSHDKFSLNW